MDLSDVGSEQFDEDNYEEKLAVWLDTQHAVTGRFDQKPIGAATPKPPLLASLEYLVIIGPTVSAMRDSSNIGCEFQAAP
jgi:hypothetical protein